MVMMSREAARHFLSIPALVPLSAGGTSADSRTRIAKYYAFPPIPRCFRAALPSVTPLLCPQFLDRVSYGSVATGSS